MRFVRALCAVAAVVLVTKSVAAEPSTVLAATDAARPIETAAPTATPKASGESTIATAPMETDPRQAAGHQSSDAALPAAVIEEMPEEMVNADPLERPEPTLFADIDLTNQRMTVKDASGKELGHWKISSARGGYSTPTGTYTVNWTSRMHYSKQYHWSPMPYSVFFNRGVAVHGTNAIGSLGRPASHGCVRAHPRDAKTFYNLVEKHGKKLTQVVVHGTPPYTPAVAERPSRRYQQQQVFSPFSFFGSPPPTYQPKKRRYRRQQQYGGGAFGAW